MFKRLEIRLSYIGTNFSAEVVLYGVKCIHFVTCRCDMSNIASPLPCALRPTFLMLIE